MAFSDLVLVVDRAVQAHLGETVRYTPSGGAAVDVAGVFFQAFYLAGQGPAGGPGVESGRPAVHLRLSDLPTDPDVDEPLITRGGVVYRVRSREKDGEGGVVLHLTEA